MSFFNENTHPSCKAEKTNHPLDPEEYDCPYKECEDGCKFLK